MAVKKIFLSALLLALSVQGAALRAEPGIDPQNAQAEELSSVKDRLLTSLFFRGELADKIMEAGMAGRFVNLDGVETNAGARSALLAWIHKNPAKAAEVYLNMKGAGGQLHDRIETREMDWKFNAKFLEVIKALNSAAGNSSVSREALELSARRLYEGEQSEAGGAPEVRAGGAGPAGNNFFSVNYAAYRLDKAGLQREILLAGAYLEAARGVGPRLEIEGAYSAAFSLYSDFIVAASALKGRDAVTEQESARLEALRAKLRSALAALALRSRISALAAAAASLEKLGAEPGAKELLASVVRLKDRLEVSAARIEGGAEGLGGLGRLVNASEKDFAGLYLRYSAYEGLLGLKRRAAGSGFSCVYDYAFYSYLASFFPDTPYPRARAELAAAAAALDAALLKAGSGDLAEALSGVETAQVEAAAGAARSASRFNRGAQFFLWGLAFRPVEYKISVRGGRAFFFPAFTFYEVAGRN
ncbi:MAG: hypothetical protein PHV36_07680 [Elusimicrobiales bacterium]|nr:hypothetical protein [Elusimicrobiales bacterium]